MSVIASDLDGLNASFPGLEEKLEKWIPCTCSKCMAADSPELFEQRRLLKRKRDGKLTVECPISYEDVSVLELLDGLKLDQFPPWVKEQPEVKANVADSVTPGRPGAKDHDKDLSGVI